jgi:hypothetical protein
LIRIEAVVCFQSFTLISNRRDVDQNTPYLLA